MWRSIRIYWGGFKTLRIPRLYPNPIQLEYPAVRSHQCFPNLPSDPNMQLALRIMLSRVSQPPPVTESPLALVPNAHPQAPDVSVAGLGSCIHLEAELLCLSGTVVGRLL